MSSTPTLADLVRAAPPEQRAAMAAELSTVTDAVRSVLEDAGFHLNDAPGGAVVLDLAAEAARLFGILAGVAGALEADTLEAAADNIAVARDWLAQLPSAQPILRRLADLEADVTRRTVLLAVLGELPDPMDPEPIHIVLLPPPRSAWLN